MFCHECGKKNLDEAKFCAFCGTRIATPDAPAAEEPKTPAPQVDAHTPYRRPASAGETVQPISENPAQPQRGDAPKPVPAKPMPVKPAPAKPAPVPPKPTMPPRSPSAPRGAMTATGGEVMPPSRAPNVKKKGRYGTVSHRAPGASPFARIQANRRDPIDVPPDDLFFEDDAIYDDDEDVIVRRLKSIIAILFLVLVCATLGWLFMSGGGRLFRANFGLPAPADTYFELGRQREQAGELKRAAEAYNSALKLDSTNYIYALQVGKAYESLGDTDMAMRAYQHSISLRDSMPEPYILLSALLDKTGNADAAGQWRRMGYDKTGDPALAEPEASPNANPDIIDAIPANPSVP